MSESNQPAWRKRPTCPGIWVCCDDRNSNGTFVGAAVLTFSQTELDHGAPFNTDFVYGPIPEPEIQGDA